MDRGIALELLAIKPGELLTHDRVRRAYLRQLRAHPPERDPEGFCQLRQAFEMLEPLARMTDEMTAARNRREQSAAPAGEVGAPAPSLDRVMWLLGERDAPIHVVTSASPDAVAQRDASARADGPDASAVPDAPPIDVPSDPVRIDEPAAPLTLGELTDELLALFERGELNAALDLAARWNHSALDDHREVSEHVAWRWALTRELCDVAAALPETLRRAIAHGIAIDELASACAAAELYQTLNPARASDLARHLAKRAKNLHTVVGSSLQSHDRDEVAPRGQRSSTGRVPIWAILFAISVLGRFAATCDRQPASLRLPDRIPVRDMNWQDPQREPAFDLWPQREVDPRTDVKIDPHPLLDLRPAGEPGQSRP